MAVLGGFRNVMKEGSPEMALVSISSATPGQSEPISQNGKPGEGGAPEEAVAVQDSSVSVDADDKDDTAGSGTPESQTGDKAKKKPAPKKPSKAKQDAKPAPAPAAEKPKPQRRKQAPKSAAAEEVPVADPDEAAADAHQRPHYSKMVRKELRLFQDQSVDLKVKSMKIHNAKFGVGERITDNTLVRIAVDMLLQREDELQGTTEQELRESMGLPPRY